MAIKKYEYAAFRVEVPVSWSLEPRVLASEWPVAASLEILRKRMNELGEEGWEIFDRAHYVSEPPAVVIYNLWARREKQVELNGAETAN